MQRQLLYSIASKLKDYVPRSVKKHLYRSRLYRSYIDAAQAQSVSLEDIQAIISQIETIPAEDYLKLQCSALADSCQVPLPKAVAVEINDTCNIDCAMCRTSLSQRRKGTMDLDLFENIVKKLSALGLSISSLHTIGDPLANPKLGEYLKIVRKHDMQIGFLSSNCLLMEKHLDAIFEFRDVILTIRPSIDAASKDVYERIRCGGKWEDLHRALVKFAERNASFSRPFPVHVNSIISKDNFHELAFIPYVFSYLAPATNFQFGFVNSLCPTNEYFLKSSYFDQIFILNTPCPMLWTDIHILKDGSLTVCCRDYDGSLLIGNVDDLEVCHNQRPILQLRSASLDGDVTSMPPLCRQCFLVDPRLSDLVNAIFKYFFLHTGKHPVYLQNTLNEIGPKMKAKHFSGIMKVLEPLARATK